MIGKLEELDEEELAATLCVWTEVTGCCSAFKVLEEGPLAAASVRGHSVFVRL